MKTFLCSLLCLAALALHAAAPPPANDDFANRISLVSSGSISTQGRNTKATTQALEPTITGITVTGSVWWQWTAPFSGPVMVSTVQSSFDTLLGVFTGDALGALTSIAEDNDSGQAFTSICSFNAQSGIPYVILIGGVNGASGKVVLNITVGSGPCTYSISPTGKSFSSAAASSTVSISTTTGCAWSAISNDSFLTITSGSSGSGIGTVAYNVAANTLLTSRTGTMTIAGATFTVTQSGAPGCTYAITPASVSIDSSAVTNTFTMTAGTGCAWTATPNASWLSIQGSASGTGNGTVTYVVATNTLTGSRSGTITAAGQSITVNQSGSVPCTYSIAPTTAPFTSAGGSSNIVISTLSGCAWTASSGVSWVTFSTTNGTGNATLSYTVASNASTLSRNGTLTVAGNSFTVTQSGAACTFTLTPTSLSIAAGASTNSLSVTAGAGCAWTAASNDSWLTIRAGTTGTGNGTVSYLATGNPDTVQRVGTLTVATHTYTVTQAAAPCIYSIAPTSAHFTSDGGSATVTVTAGTGCAWTAVSNMGFIVIDSGSSGTGNGTVAYTVAANSSTVSRTCTVTIAGSTFTITQDGTVACSYGITPSSASVGYAGGGGNISVSANAGCTWSDSSSLSWVTLSPASGSGNGTVGYTVTANPSSIARSGTCTVAQNVFSITQAGAPCSYAISPTSVSITYVGGTGSITVSATPGCNWTSSSDSSWLSITSGASGTGNGSVGYTVASQSLSSSRTGRLTIAGLTVIVSQSGAPCTAALNPTSLNPPATGGFSSVSVTMSDATCPWTSTPGATWVTISPASGTGNASVTVTALPTNQQATRTANATIGGQTLLITQVGDTTSPVVTLTAPANGSTVSNVITVSATATDNISIAHVDFYRDSAVLLGSIVTSPYNLPLNTTNLSNASHTFYARGFDPAGNQGLSTTNTVTISNGSPANTNQWAFRFGGTGDDTGRAITVDSSGNIYVTGYYTGAITFGGTPLTSAGGSPMFVAKFTSAGALTWVVGFGTGTGNTYPNSIAVDFDGAIYIGGYFLGTVNVGGSDLVSAGGYDMFLAKYTSSGGHTWSKRFGGLNNDQILGITIDGSSNIVTTGTYQGTVTVGGTNFVSSFGSTDCFLAKYSSAGAHTWSESFVNAGASEYSRAVAVDSSNNIYITGQFEGYIDFGGGLVIANSTDYFLAKFNSSGAYTWGRGYGGNGGQAGYSLTIDGSGNLGVIGTFNLQIDPGNGVVLITQHNDGFIGRYSGANGDFQWYATFGGTGTHAPTAITHDASNNFLITGYFDTNGINFGGQTLSSAGSIDIFEAKYANAGTLTWLKSFGGSGADSSSGIAVDSTGYSSITGAFTGTGVFNGTTLISAGSNDIFLLRTAP